MRLLLLGLLLGAAPAAYAAGGDSCACERKCRKAAEPENCEGACRDTCRRAEQTRVGGELLATGHLGMRVEGLSDDELEKWRREYQGRKETMERKCKAVKASDPNYAAIQTACTTGKSDIQSQLQVIESKQQERRREAAAEESRKQLCARGLALDPKTYCDNRCGACNAVGQPLELLEKRRRAADQEDAKRAAARKKKGDAKGEGGVPRDCQALYQRHLQNCLKSGQLGPKACERNAQATSKAECSAQRSLSD